MAVRPVAGFLFGFEELFVLILATMGIVHYLRRGSLFAGLRARLENYRDLPEDLAASFTFKDRSLSKLAELTSCEMCLSFWAAVVCVLSTEYLRPYCWTPLYILAVARAATMVSALLGKVFQDPISGNSDA